MKSICNSPRGVRSSVSLSTADKSSLLMGVALAVLFRGLSLFAAGTWITDSWTGGFTPAGDNLILGRKPSLPDWAAYTYEGASDSAVLTDGVATPNTTSGVLIPW